MTSDAQNVLQITFRSLNGTFIAYYQCSVLLPSIVSLCNIIAELLCHWLQRRERNGYPKEYIVTNFDLERLYIYMYICLYYIFSSLTLAISFKDGAFMALCFISMSNMSLWNTIWENITVRRVSIWVGFGYSSEQQTQEYPTIDWHITIAATNHKRIEFSGLNSRRHGNALLIIYCKEMNNFLKIQSLVMHKYIQRTRLVYGICDGKYEDTLHLRKTGLRYVKIVKESYFPIFDIERISNIMKKYLIRHVACQDFQGHETFLSVEELKLNQHFTVSFIFFVSFCDIKRLTCSMLDYITTQRYSCLMKTYDTNCTFSLGNILTETFCSS